MPTNTDFNPQQVLNKARFTVPVNIKDRDDETGAEIVRIIFVTYEYDQDTQDDFRKGIIEEVDNPDLERWQNAKLAFGEDGLTDLGPEPAAKIQQRRDYNSEEQIRKLAVKIKGVDELSDLFWRRTPPKHKAAMLETIMEDIFPNLKSSGA